MNFKVNRLRRGDRLVAIGALALVVFMFFVKWFGVDVPALILAFVTAKGVSTSFNAWHTLEVIRWLLLLTVLAAAALVVLAGMGTRPMPLSLAVVGLGLLCTALVFYRVVISHPFAHAQVKLGAWLGLLACALIAVGGYLAMTDEGDSLAELSQAPIDGETPAAPQL